MTVHFHTKHFEEVNLPLLDYMVVLLYEERNDYSVSELSSTLKVSLRTIHRIRDTLIEQGYLKGIENTRKFELTDKVYAI